MIRTQHFFYGILFLSVFLALGVFSKDAKAAYKIGDDETYLKIGGLLQVHATLQEDGAPKLLPECPPVQAFQVGLVEAGLPGFVQREFERQDLGRLGASEAKVCNTEHYVRQYVLPCATGTDQETQGSVVLVQLIHVTNSHVESGEWLREAVAIVGGGDDYVSLCYDLNTGEYDHFRVNDAY